jgi:hypothetical protein
MSLQRSLTSVSQLLQLPNKTKCAIRFLCLFGGRRTLSICTICKKPLLAFDPCFYAPSSESALLDVYLLALSCPCTIAVDPAVSAVTDLLKRHGAFGPQSAFSCITSGMVDDSKKLRA